MKVTSGIVTLEKDSQNLVGISIGGGSPNCPCLYVVQVFDNTPASKEGTLAAGDELVGINGATVKGRSKVEVARMIQTIKEKVSINFNKLHADPKQGKSLDFILKKVKHRVVENMTSSTADALGLSRAILCNDSMVKKLEELERTALTYRKLVSRIKHFLKAFFDLSSSYRAFGDVFSSIGVREPHAQASLVFSKFGETHRELERNTFNMIKTVKPMISDLRTFLHKAIPDTRLTIKKYLDSKFEYLSYCLKVKEMDDEEYSCNASNECLYRVETGNYEYRLILRCRQEARVKFAKMRNDVLVKLELLDNKHVQDTVFQLQRLVAALAQCHTDNHKIMKDNQLFPIEVDLSKGTFSYNTTGQLPADEDEDVTSESAPQTNETLSWQGEAWKLDLFSTGDGNKVEDVVDLIWDKNESLESLDSSGNSSQMHFPARISEAGDRSQRKNSSELENDLFDFFLSSPKDSSIIAPTSSSNQYSPSSTGIIKTEDLASINNVGDTPIWPNDALKISDQLVTITRDRAQEEKAGSRMVERYTDGGKVRGNISTGKMAEVESDDNIVSKCKVQAKSFKELNEMFSFFESSRNNNNNNNIGDDDNLDHNTGNGDDSDILYLHDNHNDIPYHFATEKKKDSDSDCSVLEIGSDRDSRKSSNSVNAMECGSGITNLSKGVDRSFDHQLIICDTSDDECIVVEHSNEEDTTQNSKSLLNIESPVGNDTANNNNNFYDDDDTILNFNPITISDSCLLDCSENVSKSDNGDNGEGDNDIGDNATGSYRNNIARDDVLLSGLVSLLRDAEGGENKYGDDDDDDDDDDDVILVHHF